MPVISVNQYAQKISVKVSKPYVITVDFTSLSTVYLGTDSSVSPSNYGVKLSPGSNLTWQEINSEVWAVTDTGGSASVSIIFEASGSISGSVSNLASVYPKLLQTKNITYNAAVSGAATVNTLLDNQIIQGYAAVRIQISVTPTNASSSSTSTLQTGAYIAFQGVQSITPVIPASFTSLIFPTNGALWPFGNPSFIDTLALMPSIQTYDFPITNTYLTNAYISHNLGTGETSAAGIITVRIYGLYNVVVPQERYVNFSGGGTQIRGQLFNTSRSSSFTAQNTDSVNGAATLTIAPTTTGLTALSTVIQVFTAPPTSLTLAAFSLPTPGTINNGQVYQLTLPNAPITIAGGLTGVGSATWNLTTTRN